ncbi:MAG: hypothetical protein NUV59_00085 [Patescibacteria group bacterium]|nr:hypothetical protein [Patescibacteria group bacterium]
MSVPALRFVWMAIFVALALSAASLLIPAPAYAVGAEADNFCTPVIIDGCGCGLQMTSKGCQRSANKYLCVCADVTSGFTTTGLCVAEKKCEAVTTGGKGVDSGLSQLAQQLGKMLGDLFKGGQDGGGDSGSQSTGQCPGGYYQTSVPSSDPCAQYVAPTSAQIDTGAFGGSNTGSSALLNSLLGNTQASPIGSSALIDLTTGTDAGASGQIDIAGNTPGTAFRINSLISSDNSTDDSTGPANTTNTPNAVASGTASPSGVKTSAGGATGIRNVVTMSGNSTSTDASAAPPESGVSGDITVGEGGATVTAGTTDAEKNTTVAGFYGSDAPGGQSQGLAARWCESRPWAGNFLSVIIPPTFFDNLCTWRGYQVGPEEPSAPTLQQTDPAPKPPAPPPAATSTAPAVAPRVDIWAVPPTVPLDTRTSIFWNAQGVTECTETSPDGSFSHSTLSGGAATVPLVRATTFTISCLAPDGSYVSGYVTVNIAI